MSLSWIILKKIINKKDNKCFQYVVTVTLNKKKIKKDMKKFYESLREHAVKLINSKEKKRKLLTKEQQEPYENVEIYYTCKEKIENKYLKEIKYHKVRNHCHYTRE